MISNDICTFCQIQPTLPRAWPVWHEEKHHLGPANTWDGTPCPDQCWYCHRRYSTPRSCSCYFGLTPQSNTNTSRECCWIITEILGWKSMNITSSCFLDLFSFCTFYKITLRWDWYETPFNTHAFQRESMGNLWLCHDTAAYLLSNWFVVGYSRSTCPSGEFCIDIGIKVLQKRFSHFGNSDDMRWSFTMCFPFVFTIFDSVFGTNHEAQDTLQFSFLTGSEGLIVHCPSRPTRSRNHTLHQDMFHVQNIHQRLANLLFWHFAFCCKALTWFSKKDMGIGCSLDWYDHHQWLTCVLWWTSTSENVPKCYRL